MKIREKKEVSKQCTEYRFDNGAWVSICAGYDTEDGSWEYQWSEDDEESYSEGGLWFEGKTLVDFDGCFELPKEVEAALKDLGYEIE